MVIASHHIPSTFRMAQQIVLLVDGAAVSGSPEWFHACRDSKVEHFFAGEAK
jgi:ABC-type transporter Mla maintaining outer membrane lipid asymmetry ATPase subunit MlaF